MRHDNRSHKERARKERSCLLRQAVIQDVMFISFRAWPPANTQPHSREIHERSKILEVCDLSKRLSQSVQEFLIREQWIQFKFYFSRYWLSTLAW